MPAIKKILILAITILVVTSCGPKKTATIEQATVTPPLPTQPAYPYPVPQALVATVDNSYPEPADGGQPPQAAYTPEYYVKNLDVPTPSSGKAVVTGQLLVGGEGGEPYMATLFLASVLPPSTPDYPPLISFSESTDQIAMQDVDTGRFVFADVAPGQYAIILWSPLGGNPLVDANGNQVILTATADKVEDLGIIPIK